VKCWKQDRFAVVGFVPEGSSRLLKNSPFASLEG
jgi:hypothetical protein